MTIEPPGAFRLSDEDIVVRLGSVANFIWVRLFWNDVQAAQFQALDEKEGFPSIGKGGDMIISLGFRFKNAIQRLGGTYPPPHRVFGWSADTRPGRVITTKQFYYEMFSRETQSASHSFAHLHDADLVGG